MAKYTIYPNKSINYTSKQGAKYKIINKKGKIVCYLDGKKCKPTKEILSRFTPSGGKYTVYTDGGCIYNPGGRGGYGIVIIEPSGKVIQLSKGYISSTNNRMELIAAIEGVKATPRAATVELFSDSKYLISTMKGAYKKNKNLDLWTALDRECACRNVTFEWVKGHEGNKLNESCDRLAKTAMKGKKLSVDNGYSSEDKTLQSFPAVNANENTPSMGQVNKKCKMLMRDFLQKKNPTFRDYAILKTGGKDTYSEKGRTELQSICKANLEEIRPYINEENIIYVLRWNCRGLSLKDSIIKVMVDKYINDMYNSNKK